MFLKYFPNRFSEQDFWCISIFCAFHILAVIDILLMNIYIDTSQNIDTLMVAETNIDDSFPKEQFFMEGYSYPLRLDRDGNGGGLLVYVRSDIPSTELKSFKFDNDVECVCSEINLLAIFCTSHSLKVIDTLLMNI